MIATFDGATAVWKVSVGVRGRLTPHTTLVVLAHDAKEAIEIAESYPIVPIFPSDGNSDNALGRRRIVVHSLEIISWTAITKEHKNVAISFDFDSVQILQYEKPE